MSLRPYIHISCLHLSELRTRLSRIKIESSDSHANELARQGIELLENALIALDKDNEEFLTNNSIKT